MDYTNLGRTELRVSRVGLGCARIGGIFQNQTRIEVQSLLKGAFDAGITFYDTSDLYCQGESEELLGEAFSRMRDKVIIASKVGYTIPHRRRIVASVKPLIRPLITKVRLHRDRLPKAVRGQLDQDFSAMHIESAVNASLRRLRTDYIDLYQLHSPPSEVLKRGEVFATLAKLQCSGKVRYVGVSCESADDVRLCAHQAELAALQMRISLMDQTALSVAGPLAKEACIGVVARECFGGGVLARINSLSDLQMGLPPANTSLIAQKQQLARLLLLARQSGRTVRELALQFVLALDFVSVALVGARTLNQLEDVSHLFTAPPLQEEELGRIRIQGGGLLVL
jgi:aryl-alcohol dehydrogenase-like predicted oxidoreductase